MNHALTAPHLLRIKAKDVLNDICGFCQRESQTREHLFFRCHRWTTQREKLLRRVGWNRARPGNARELFASTNPEHIAAILDFLRETQVGTGAGINRLEVEEREFAEETGGSAAGDEWGYREESQEVGEEELEPG